MSQNESSKAATRQRPSAVQRLEPGEQLPFPLALDAVPFHARNLHHGMKQRHVWLLPAGSHRAVGLRSPFTRTQCDLAKDHGVERHVE